ncbi:MAG TPA: TraR/DksA family transcriptional regulator [Roseiflexaceae bacterium]|nr:TraR/DksA family transcriptional regulator [Roseiflexaceae bacterium]
MSKHANKLTPSQIEGFRVRLEAMRAALRAQLADAQQELAAPDTIVDAELDQGDDANLLFAHEELLDLIARQQAEVAQVERALARITAGTYGTSEVSGRPIPIERLNARPYATTRVDEPPPPDE